MSPDSWLRLEPNPVEPSVAASLAAPIADPLWLLHCQWRAGEFAGVDGGSPVLNEIEYDCSTITRLRGAVPGTSPDTVILPAGTMPLEYLLEAEPEPGPRPSAWTTPGGSQRDYPSRALAAARAGQHFLRLLHGQAGLGDTTDYLAGLLTSYPVAADPGTPVLRGYAGRVPDGQALYADLLGLRRDPPSWPTVPARTGVVDATLRGIVLRWLDWYEATSSVSGLDVAEAPKWAPLRLEYACDVAAPGPGAETILRAVEYDGDGLDWWDFDLLGSSVEPAPVGASLGASTADPAAPGTTSGSSAALASPVRYAGAPDPRWWTFEDAAVNFGDISAPVESSTTSVVMEFALVFSNDHYLVPVQVPVGELRRVTRLVVTDSFGRRVLVPAAADLTRNAPFRLFEHSLPDGHRDPLLFLAPTVAQPAQSWPARRCTTCERRPPNSSGRSR